MRRPVRSILVFAASSLLAAAAPAQVNLLKNPGFDADIGTNSWNISWGTFSREAWNSPDGQQAGYIKGAVAGNNGGVIQQLTGIKPGATYNLSARFRTEDDVFGDYCFKLEFFSDAHGMLLALTNRLTDLVKGRWVSRQITGKAPEGATKAQVVFEGNNISGTGSVGSDGWKLERIAP